ncbi:MAG: rhodanese-like domain-containing protein [Oligoflexia bacterium]|nr:rhodanese-like domain-containing protein [Oligoflexia bacterium]
MIKLVMFLLLAPQLAAAAEEKKAVPESHFSMPKVCLNCHEPREQVYRGYFESVAFKAKAIQLKTDDATLIFKFDEEKLKVELGDKTHPAEHLREVKKGHEIEIKYEERDGEKHVVALELKPPIDLPAEKLISVAEVAKLVALGSEKGKFLLVDSRPLPRFQEGFIPTAVNLPYPAFKKLAADRLPKDKDTFLIFYCGGVTCQMSPKSSVAAEKLGYTKIKVFHGGVPEWSKKNFTHLTAQFLKEAWIDKDVPHILIDARGPAAIKEGFIKGAVALEVAKVKAASKTFPKADKKAPFIVYGATEADAAAVAKAILATGQTNVKVLVGGVAAWTAAGHALEKGEPGSKIAYVPKPRPGEIAAEEFNALAAKTPEGTVILDVRDREETKAGTIPGALLIPADEIVTRIGELPKDKLLVTYCSTGVRAEMAYHTLKERGFNAKFLNGEPTLPKKVELKKPSPAKKRARSEGC